MLNFDFLSRNVADPSEYRQILIDRLEAKRTKDYSKADALKLVLNLLGSSIKHALNPIRGVLERGLTVDPAKLRAIPC